MKLIALRFLCGLALLGCAQARSATSSAHAAGAGPSPPVAPAATAAGASGAHATTPPPAPISQPDAGGCAGAGCADPPPQGPTPEPAARDAGSPVVTTAPAVCGNGVLEPGEACEPCPPQPATCNAALLGGKSCESLGFARGTVVCSTSCLVDVSAYSRCGDGEIDEGEDCDGADLEGMSCFGLGFSGGTLGCDSVTCRYDTSMCAPNACVMVRFRICPPGSL